MDNCYVDKWTHDSQVGKCSHPVTCAWTIQVLIGIYGAQHLSIRAEEIHLNREPTGADRLANSEYYSGGVGYNSFRERYKSFRERQKE